MIRVLVVDDHRLFREALAFMLEREPDILAVGTAGTIAEARPQLPGVDVAILDLGLPDGDGRGLIAPFRGANPGGKALILASDGDPEGARGADEVLPKTAGLADFIDTVRRLGRAASPLSLI